MFNSFISGAKAPTDEMPFESYTLSNGIRLVHQGIVSPVAYCSLTINAGSRDEALGEHGAAHLVEHIIFKQTAKRKAHHILSRMENVGGEINAYTTKEDTCIHAAFLNIHYERALELLNDIVFNHVISDKILQLEKSVVIDEIKSYQDNPSELIFDEFDKLLFPDHPLGRCTLGSKQSLNRLKPADIDRFVSKHYHPCRMVISSVGNIPFKRLIYYAEKYFGKIQPEEQTSFCRTAPPEYVVFQKEIIKRNHQSHCIIGKTCNSMDRPFRIAMTMLANLLGGTGMNTRLNMSLRERLGLVYHVEASYTPYSDVGVFQIYFASDRSKVEKCVLQIEKELDKLKKAPLTDEQLKRLQLQVMGQLAIASDSNDARMLSAGKSILMFDKIDSFNEVCAQIAEINAKRLHEIANDVFGNFSILKHY